ncbi:SHOCT domain-containing protein [Gordonia soli]|nr:SHOCT domain-containing protein [Gordonia soli]
MTMFGEAGTGPRTPGFLWSFLKTFAFVMLCGIVGPIFLVAYFVVDQPGIEWMLWTGLGITLLDVVIAFGIAFAGYSGQVKTSRLRAVGRVGVADVLGIEQTNIQINDQPLMKLRLRIHGDEIVAFETEKRMVVPIFQQPLLHSRRLSVLVDPDSNDFEIDWQGTALLSGSVPAQFTSSEDGRTYDLTGQAEPLSKILEILRAHGVSENLGTVDLRSNPEARAAVMNVVRSYASARGAAAGPAQTPPPSNSVTSTPTGPPTSTADNRSLGVRLAELEDLRIAGSISDVEYAAARQRILDSI